MDKKVRDMKLKKGERIIIKYKYNRYILFIIIFIITYLLLIATVAPKKYDFIEGDIARSDIKAPREIIDEKASEEKLNEALAKVEEQRTLREDVKKQAESNLKSLFDKVISLNLTSSELPEKISELKHFEAIKLTDDECNKLLNIPKDRVIEIQQYSIDAIDTAYQNVINDKNKDELDDAKRNASRKIREFNIDDSTTSLLDSLVLEQIKPNCFYDKDKTDEKIKEVQKNTPKVIIKYNQTVV